MLKCELPGPALVIMILSKDLLGLMKTTLKTNNEWMTLNDDNVPIVWFIVSSNSEGSLIFKSQNSVCLNDFRHF